MGAPNAPSHRGAVRAAAEALRGDMNIKRDVRKLRTLGLARSLPEGHELTRRGAAYPGRRNEE